MLLPAVVLFRYRLGEDVEEACEDETAFAVPVSPIPDAMISPTLLAPVCTTAAQTARGTKKRGIIVPQQAPDWTTVGKREGKREKRTAYLP